MMIRCTLCGRDCSRRYRHAADGTPVCADHRWCRQCRTAHLDEQCAEERSLVQDARVAAALATGVLADLRAVGIELPRVPVTLVEDLPGAQDGRCLKAALFGGTGPRSASVEVRRGLGPTRFGHVTAHEHTHALLHLAAGPRMDATDEEGLCELVAVVWLTQRSTPPGVLHDLWANPDPVYGRSMRRLVRLARRHGVHAVLRRAIATGLAQ